MSTLTSLSLESFSHFYSYQERITFMENIENTLINTDMMKVDEHALVLIKNRLHH